MSQIPLFGGLNLCQRLYHGLLKQAWKTTMTIFPDLHDGLFWRFYSGVSREIFDILPISSRFSSLSSAFGSMFLWSSALSCVTRTRRIMWRQHHRAYGPQRSRASIVALWWCGAKRLDLKGGGFQVWDNELFISLSGRFIKLWGCLETPGIRSTKGLYQSV